MPPRRKDRARKGTGSVYWDVARNRWVGEITLDGQRRKVHADSRAEARDKLNDIIRGVVVPPVSTTTAPTVARLFESWLARDVAGRDLAPSTIVTHKWCAGLWVEVIGNLSVDQLTVTVVEEALDLIHARHQLGRASMVKSLSTLRQALRFALRRSWVTTNAADGALVPATARRPVRRTALAPGDARRLLDQLGHEDGGLLWALSLRLGLRPGEAAGLDWEDVDLTNGTINVRRTLQTDERGAVSAVDRLKVESSRRTLGIPSDLAPWLRQHRANQPVVALSGSGPLFPGVDPSKARKQLAAICGRAGVPHIRPNELRHSCASLLIDSGARIEEVADLLGHTSTRMLDSTYRHRLRPVVDIASAPEHDWTKAEAR